MKKAKWNWKTIIYLGFAPALTILTGILPLLESVGGQVNIKYGHVSVGQIAIFGIIIVITVLNYLLTVWSPYKILKEIRRRRWSYFSDIQSDLNNAFGANRNVFFNVMIIQSELVREQTGRKQKDIPEVEEFELVWQGGPVNTALKLKTNEGCCSDAFEKGSFQPYDLQKMREKNMDLKEAFNMTAEQVKQTEHVKLLFCLPIEFNVTNENRDQKKYIGVVNAEVHSDDGRTFIIDNPALIDRVHSSMTSISHIYTSSRQRAY